MMNSGNQIAWVIVGALSLSTLSALGEPAVPRDDGPATKVGAPSKLPAAKKDSAPETDDLNAPLPPLEPPPDPTASSRPDPLPEKSAPATAPTTTTATAPSKNKSADEMIGDMLKAPAAAGGRPLQSSEAGPMIDRKSGVGSVKPNAPPVTVLREGSFVVDRIGRLTHNPDGTQPEFTFESDGGALRDPPLMIVPNLKLMAMEDAVQGANRDLRFRATGMVTEYRGRNYILFEKVVVVPEATQQYNPNKNQ